jgi:hypothetical protein
LEAEWDREGRRLNLIPGKEALVRVNQWLQREYGISLTPTSIINAMTDSEIPDGIVRLIEQVEEFSRPPS